VTKSSYSQAIDSFDLGLNCIERDFFSTFGNFDGKSRDNLLLSLPWATLASFQIELCFKFLIEIAGSTAPHIHNLKELFELLPAMQQGQIREAVDESDFADQLDKIASLFIKSRYFDGHEHSYRPSFVRKLRMEVLAIVNLENRKRITVYRKLNGEWQEVD